MDTQELIGTIVAQKYRVERLLARGGFSSVYLATQAGVDRYVALKVLDLRGELEASWLERFTREARLVSQLRHPNTITIFDYGQQGQDFLYIAMEYIEGASLNRTIRREGPLDSTRVARIGAAICASLDEAHGRGILHRDLKPSNIMLTTDHRGEELIRVLDFGMAKVLETASPADAQVTRQRVFVGTPRYASPEHLRREELDPRSDLYGLGLVLWEALVGEPAVPAVDYAECKQHHLASHPWRIPPAADCPAQLATIVETLLRRDPAERYRSCEEAQAALDAFVASVEFAEEREARGDQHALTELGAVDEFDRLQGFDPTGLSEKPGTPRGPLSIPSRPPAGSSPPAPKPAGKPAMKPDQKPDQKPKQKPKQKPRSPLELDQTPLVRQDHARRRAAQSAGSRPARNPAPASLLELLAEHRGLAIAAAAVLLALATLGVVLYRGEGAPPAPPATIAAIPAEVPPEVVDPTPSLDTKVVLLAIRTAGWQISNPQPSHMSDVIQTNVMATKGEFSANVTVYECQGRALAEELDRSTTSPSESVTFGRTVVRIAPGSQRAMSGVAALAGAMNEFKAIARKEGVMAAQDLAPEP